MVTLNRTSWYMYLDTPQGSPFFFIRNFRHLWPQRNSQLVIAARIPGKQDRMAPVDVFNQQLVAWLTLVVEPKYSRKTQWFWNSFQRYCWWKKFCTSLQVDNPIFYKVLYIPGGAEFLPSTVWGKLENQQSSPSTNKPLSDGHVKDCERLYTPDRFPSSGDGIWEKKQKITKVWTSEFAWGYLWLITILQNKLQNRPRMYQYVCKIKSFTSHSYYKNCLIRY